jgi:hypothetical protein
VRLGDGQVIDLVSVQMDSQTIKGYRVGRTGGPMEISLGTVALIEERSFNGWKTLGCVALVGVGALGVSWLVFVLMMLNDPNY